MKIKNSLLLAVFLLSSCGHSTTTQNPPDTSVRSTTWNWVNSEGGFRGGVVTPATAGYRQYYIFRSDSTLSFVRTPDTTNSSWNGAYHIFRQYYAMTGDTQFVINFYLPHGIEPAGTIQRLQYRGQDTIMIGEDAADGIIETYARAR